LTQFVHHRLAVVPMSQIYLIILCSFSLERTKDIFLNLHKARFLRLSHSIFVLFFPSSSLNSSTFFLNEQNLIKCLRHVCNQNSEMSHFEQREGVPPCVGNENYLPKWLLSRHVITVTITLISFSQTHHKICLFRSIKKDFIFQFQSIFYVHTHTSVRQWFFILEDLCQNKSRVIEWKGFFFVPVYYYYPLSLRVSISSSQSQ
jgi:hypothetical protein